MQQQIYITTTPAELKKLIRDSVKEILPEGKPEGKSERMSQRQASEYLGITQPTIIEWKRKGLIPFHQIPHTRKIYYLRSELKEAAKRLSNF